MADILENVSRSINATVAGSTIQKVENLIKDDDWQDENLRCFGDDDFEFEPGSGGALLKQIYNTKFIEQHSDLKLWRAYALARRFLAKIRVVRRLMDTRNPGLDIDREPQPDGQNIQNRHLRTAWILHIPLTRALHYRSLSIGGVDHGWAQLQHIETLATMFLAFECDDHGFKPKENQQNPLESNGLAVFSNQVSQALDKIGNDLKTETKPFTANAKYSLEDTIAYNIFQQRF